MMRKTIGATVKLSIAQPLLPAAHRHGLRSAQRLRLEYIANRSIARIGTRDSRPNLEKSNSLLRAHPIERANRLIGICRDLLQQPPKVVDRAGDRALVEQIRRIFQKRPTQALRVTLRCKDRSNRTEVGIPLRQGAASSFGQSRSILG